MPRSYAQTILPFRWVHVVPASRAWDLESFSDSTIAPVGFVTNSATTPFTCTFDGDDTEVSVTWQPGVPHAGEVGSIPDTNATQVTLLFNNIKGT